MLVAQYAEILRESVWAQQTGSNLSDLAAHVDHIGQLLADDEDVVDFIGLVPQAASITSCLLVRR